MSTRNFHRFRKRKFIWSYWGKIIDRPGISGLVLTAAGLGPMKSSPPIPAKDILLNNIDRLNPIEVLQLLQKVTRKDITNSVTNLVTNSSDVTQIQDCYRKKINLLSIEQCKDLYRNVYAHFHLSCQSYRWEVTDRIRYRFSADNIRRSYQNDRKWLWKR